jgi:two-component sensor histidine kinase
VASVQTALEARRHQWRIRDDFALQSELQREMSHRVKNVLAIVQSIYRMTRRRSSSLEDFAAKFEGRLEALSRVHALLIHHDRTQELREILLIVLAPYIEKRHERRIRLRGENIEIGARAALALSLCVFELATNAAKYGALATGQGAVSVQWGHASDRDLELSWIEHGATGVTVPQHEGYGTRFLRSTITNTLQGRIRFDYAPHGLQCVMTLPLEQLLI